MLFITWEIPKSSILSLIANVYSQTFYLYLFCLFVSLSFTVVVYGWLLLYDDRTFSFACIIAVSSQTHTQLKTNTHLSCCAVSWVATFWAYMLHRVVSLQCSVWKLPIPLCLLSQLCVQLCQGHTTGILLYWMTEKHVSIQLWVRGCDLQLWNKTHQTWLFLSCDYFPHLTANPEHKLKTALVFSVKVKSKILV